MENELKYIVWDDRSNLLLIKSVVETFQLNGYTVVSMEEKQNFDAYYDTRELSFYQRGVSLRIRKVMEKGGEKFKGTYKTPVEKGEVYASRVEIEKTLQNGDFESFVEEMKKTEAGEDFTHVVRTPVMDVVTDRIDVILEKNGLQVCLSLDTSVYTNNYLDKMIVAERMIEVEAFSGQDEKLVLDEIHGFMIRNMDNIRVNKQSKYERGIENTVFKYQLLQKDDDAVMDMRF